MAPVARSAAEPRSSPAAQHLLWATLACTAAAQPSRGFRLKRHRPPLPHAQTSRPVRSPRGSAGCVCWASTARRRARDLFPLLPACTVFDHPVDDGEGRIHPGTRSRWRMSKPNSTPCAGIPNATRRPSFPAVTGAGRWDRPPRRYCFPCRQVGTLGAVGSSERKYVVSCRICSSVSVPEKARLHGGISVPGTPPAIRLLI